MKGWGGERSRVVFTTARRGREIKWLWLPPLQATPINFLIPSTDSEAYTWNATTQVHNLKTKHVWHPNSSSYIRERVQGAPKHSSSLHRRSRSVNSDADAFQNTQSETKVAQNYTQSNFFIPPQKSLRSPSFTSDSPSQWQDSAVPRPSSFGLKFGRSRVRNTAGTDTEVCLSTTRHRRQCSKLDYRPFPTPFTVHSLVIKNDAT
jgi:hypothetical protein